MLARKLSLLFQNMKRHYTCGSQPDLKYHCILRHSHFIGPLDAFADYPDLNRLYHRAVSALQDYTLVYNNTSYAHQQPFESETEAALAAHFVRPKLLPGPDKATPARFLPTATPPPPERGWTASDQASRPQPHPLRTQSAAPPQRRSIRPPYPRISNAVSRRSGGTLSWRRAARPAPAPTRSRRSPINPPPTAQTPPVRGRAGSPPTRR